MSTKYYGTLDLSKGKTVPIPQPPKKKEEASRLFVSAFSRFSKHLDTKVVIGEKDEAVETKNETVSAVKEDYALTPGGTIFNKNEIIYDDFPEEVVSEQPIEGNYNSIWSKPKIRPNTEFEPEEELILDEDTDCECAIEAPVLFSAKKANTWQPSSSPQENSTVEEIEPLTATWQPSFDEILAVAKEELGELLTVKETLMEENTVEKNTVKKNTLVTASNIEYVNIADNVPYTVEKKDPALYNTNCESSTWL